MCYLVQLVWTRNSMVVGHVLIDVKIIMFNNDKWWQG